MQEIWFPRIIADAPAVRIYDELAFKDMFTSYLERRGGEIFGASQSPIMVIQKCIAEENPV